MGLSSSKTTQTSTTKPVYASQTEGAASTVTDAYNSQKSNIASLQDSLNSMASTAANNYQNNDVLDAAKGYVTSTLGTDYSANPYLQSQIDATGASVANKTNTALGTRGLAGGSVAAKITAGQLAQNESALRYTDYNNWANRQQSAASMASGLSSADATNLSAALSAASSAGGFTTNAANNYAGTISGLLGQYTTGTQTTQSSPSALSLLASLGSSAAGLISSSGGLSGLLGKSGTTAATSSTPYDWVTMGS